MGRRALVTINPRKELSPLDGHAAATAALRKLLRKYDISEFEAQKHAVEMVQILAGFARDVTADVAFRRQCANDVLNRAYGTPTEKKQVTILDPNAETDKGATIGAEIEAIHVETRRLEERDRLIAQKVPFDQWPEDVRVLPDSVIYAELLSVGDDEG